MNCQQIRRLMPANRYARLVPTALAAFEQHVDGCPTCASAWLDEQFVDAHLSALPIPEPPGGLKAALLAVPRSAAAPSSTARNERAVATQDAPMTLSEWLRTFVVLLALGLLGGGFAGESRRATNVPISPETVAPLSGAGPTIIARQGQVDLSVPAAEQAAIVSRVDRSAPSDTFVTPPRAATLTPEALALAIVPELVQEAAPLDAPRRNEGRRSSSDNDDEPATEPAPPTDTANAPNVPVAGQDRGGKDGGMVGARPDPVSPTEPPDDEAPWPTAHARVPIVVFADVGGVPAFGCRGCDGHLSQSDRDIAASEGLVLPPFQIAISDSASRVYEFSFVPDGPVFSATLDIEGVAPFQATLYVQSETWLPCANVDARSHSFVVPLAGALRFPVVDQCPAPVGPEPEPEPLPTAWSPGEGSPAGTARP